jgi:hypothetical protein
VLTAAALHGVTTPDLLDEVAWCQTDDFWQIAIERLGGLVPGGMGAGKARACAAEHGWPESTLSMSEFVCVNACSPLHTAGC